MIEEFIANRYQPVRTVGSGGMGTVFHVYDRLADEHVALKQVKVSPDQLQFASQIAPQKEHDEDSSDHRYALTVEFRTLASLRHPHIISVLDYGFDHEQQPYFTMQYINNAKTITEYAKGLDTTQKIELLIQLLEALSYLHRRSIIHRDLKPGNVLIDTSGNLKVLDFGLALSSGGASDDAEDDEAAGTIMYMSPELFHGDRASVYSDLYAVGVIAYEILLEKPFWNSTISTSLINYILLDLPDMSGIDYPLSSVIERLLRKTPQERYESAETVIDVICEAMNMTPPDDHESVRESFLQAADFVGREQEIATLRDQLSNVKSGKSTAWLIGGESGIGKSRLLDELRIRAVVDGARVLRGRAVDGASTSYQLWRNIVRHLVISTELDDKEASILKPLIPDLSRILERPIPDMLALEGETANRRLAHTIIDLLRRQTVPIILILEDLQWAGESLEILKLILSELDQFTSLFVIGSYRSDDVPDLSDRLPAFNHMILKRFDQNAVISLSRSMIGESGDNPELINLLMRETEGNVFFMVEVMRVLAEEAGRLSQIASTTLPKRIVAGGVQSVVRRHLQKVSNEALEIVKYAALIGRLLDFKLLAYITPDVDLDAWLTMCANASIFDVSDEKWQFSHDKIRETIIEDLQDDKNLPSLHNRIASAIEAVYPDNNDYIYSLTLHHEAAGNTDAFLANTEKTLRYLKKISDYEDSAALGLRALSTIQSRNKDADLRKKIEIMLQLTAIYERSSEISKSLECAEQALEAARELGDKKLIAHALHANVNPFQRLGRFQEGIAYDLEAYELVKDTDENWIKGAVLAGLGALHLYIGIFDKAADYLQKGIEYIKASGDEWGLVAATSNYAGALVQLDKRDEAEELLEKASKDGERIGDLKITAQNLGNLGIVVRRRGEFERARNIHQRALTIKRQFRDTHGIAVTNYNLGEIELNMANYDQAQSHFEEALSSFENLGDIYSAIFSRAMLAVVLNEAKMYEEARKMLCVTLGALGKIDIPQVIAKVLISGLYIMESTQHTEPAAKCLGSLEANPVIDIDDTELLDHVKNRIQAQLKPYDYEELTQIGRGLSLKQSIDLCFNLFCEENASKDV